MNYMNSNQPFSGKNTRFRILVNHGADGSYLYETRKAGNVYRQPLPERKNDINKQNAVLDLPAVFLTKTFN